MIVPGEMKPDHIGARPNFSSDPLIPTIFHEPWWLDIATKGTVDYVEVTDGGRVVGRMPYIVTTRFGLSSSNMPTLTHFLGPGINDGTGSAPNRFIKRHSIARELIKKLPPLSAFRQKMHRGVNDTLSFQAEGFNVGVQFTFEVHPAPATVMWKAMRDKTRNVIRRAEETLNVEVSVDPGIYFDLTTKNLKAANADSNVDLDVCEKIVVKALDLGRGRIWVARDKNGDAKSAIFCAWDSTTFYYIMSTRASDSGNGAIPLLLWHAMKSAASMELVFDFDGIGSAGAVLLYAGFGGNVVPRYIVGRSSMTYRLLRQIRRLNPTLENKFT
ncbi:hypothetical protein [Neorhizobium sp. JUb45]|uniref:hypothetical protein n=1 Tax=unclassified Neorhizobium TaxID=2629175 RepID=UPI0010DAC906|nr:hypothetical protein [Neorhizobium sp. JUb45]TCQ99972.1 hypothetical protein EDF70_10750 [Neorhizobium sp. JUb45]